MTDPTVAMIAESAESVDQIQQLVELQALESGILVFFLVVVLCYFGYKFLRLFF